jgi:hypothetical protein
MQIIRFCGRRKPPFFIRITEFHLALWGGFTPGALNAAGIHSLTLTMDRHASTFFEWGWEND